MTISDPVPLHELASALVFAAVGSLFAAADAALGSLTAARLEALAEVATGPSRAALRRYVADPERRHSRWLVGRVVFTSLSAVQIGVVTYPAVPRWAVAPAAALGALLSYGIFAEVAMTLARRRADLFATRVVGFLRPLEVLMLPLAVPLGALGALTARVLGPASPSAIGTESEVEWAVSEGQKAGSIAPEPAEMIRNVLELKDLTMRDVMVPRTKVSALEVETPLADVLRFVASEGHSRYPVYRGTIDNVVGLLYAKDLFRVVRVDGVATTPLAALLRVPADFVPESQGLSDVLREMRARRHHLAIVVDEFGGTSGIVTLEDVLEEIVGEIRDEYDTDEPGIQTLEGGGLLVDAATSMHDLSTHLGIDLPTEGDFDSVGGLVVHHVGRVPEAGTSIELAGLRFVVREADARRIARVEIVRVEPADGASKGAERDASRSATTAKSPSAPARSA